MKKSSKFRFIAGIIAVILVFASLFVYLNYSMSRVDSTIALLRSDTYTVGIDYSGIIEKQFIDEGAYVKTGDPLFELRSPTLSDAIRNNVVAKSSLLYSLTSTGLANITAAAPGQVQSIAYRQGAFVPANSQIAIINIENKLYVEATYKLSSPDYSRLNTNSKLTIVFPDNNRIEGSVYDFKLATVNSEVLTTVRARFNQSAINTTTFTVGTPLKTTLFLDSDTWYNTIKKQIQLLIQPSTK